MALFGKKNAQSISNTMETVDFSNDTWSYKGDAPNYQIQSDGFTYDIQDADGNEKNAICLGLLGMLIIVLNAKSPKIKEDELLPLFSKVIKTRNWHTMTVKEANFLSQTAIKKLSSSAMSGDVFDLASYAPLEIKRVLLKTLFSVSRTMMKVEFRETAEHRIIDDIVPEIFANSDYELALLTGLIVKAESKPDKVKPAVESIKAVQPDREPEGDSEPELKFEPESKVTFESMPEPEPIPTPVLEMKQPEAAAPQFPEPVQVQEAPVQQESASGSAFDELQRLYGRRSDSVRPQMKTFDAAAGKSTEIPAPQAVPEVAPQTAQPVQNENNAAFTPQDFPQVAYAQNNKAVGTDFASPQPNNPFAAVPQQFGTSQNFEIPRPAMPDFGMNMPQNTFAQMGSGAWGGNMQQSAQNYNIPQPPMPNYGMGQMNQPQNPYVQPQNSQAQTVNSQPAQNPNFSWQQGNAYAQGYPQQNPMPQNNNYMNNNNWQQYPQQNNMRQNMPQGYPQQPQQRYNSQNMPNLQQGWQNNPQQNGQNSSRS